MITEHSNKNNLITSINSSKNNKIEKEILFIKKRAVSLTPSLTNMEMASHKIKKIFNRNIITNNKSNSIIKSRRKNKIIENKKQKIKKIFKSILIKEINNSNSNYNADLNNNNYNNNINLNSINHLTILD